jgi:hypothetical protein
MLRRVALVRTDVSEEFSASFIRVTRISELGTSLAVTSIVPSSPILVTLMLEAIRSSETSVLTRATRRNIPEDAILLCTQFRLSRESVCYADNIWVKWNNSEGKTVLTCTAVQYAILYQTLNICLRMLQNNIACIQGLHLFFVQWDVFVLLWNSSLWIRTDDIVKTLKCILSKNIKTT